MANDENKTPLPPFHAPNVGTLFAQKKLGSPFHTRNL